MKKIEKVLEYFRKLNEIPRGSGNEKRVMEYLESWAKEKGLDTEMDATGNLVIRKEATKGYENSPGVVLQGHSDMVTEKVKDSDHDFERDPITHVMEGDILKADGTTLGADNGIAIAMAQMILTDEDVQHPPLEVLITVDEEREMTGALNLTPDLLRGRMLINIDSEEEGIITLGSAGGELLTMTLPKKTEEWTGTSYRFSFHGFLGGHSGMAIHEPKGNMIKVMADFMERLSEKTVFRIVTVDSGTKDNSIPREGFIVLSFKDRAEEEMIQDLITELRNENSNTEGELIIDYSEESEESSESAISDRKTGEDLIGLLRNLPHGVLATEKSNPSLTETSANLAIVRDKSDRYEIQVSTRSSVAEKLTEIRTAVNETSGRFNATLEASGAYPGWAYREESRLRDVTMDTFKEMTGKDMKAEIIHAGLECGAIIEKYPDMDAVSIGPDIRNAHTPDEYMHITSTERVYEHLVRILKELR